MLAIRPYFERDLAALKTEIAVVEGYLAPRDIKMLALAAMHPTTPGEVLEIGAFRGKSTVLLSKAAALAGNPRIHSCDPLTWSEAAVRPTPAQARAGFDRNLRTCGVLEKVQFYQMTSTELGSKWNRPLRLLWIDGDHSYAGVKSDLRLFLPHLQDGGMLLMHDVLSACSGPSRGFLEDVLASPHFGPCGIHGNVAWAQYQRDADAAKPHAAGKRKLAKALAPLVPYQTSEQGERVMTLWNKWIFKLLRSRVPLASPPPESWLPAAIPLELQAA